MSNPLNDIIIHIDPDKKDICTRKKITILSNQLLTPASKSDIYEFDWDEKTTDSNEINQVGNNIFSCFRSK